VSIMERRREDAELSLRAANRCLQGTGGVSQVFSVHNAKRPFSGNKQAVHLSTDEAE